MLTQIITNFFNMINSKYHSDYPKHNFKKMLDFIL